MAIISPIADSPARAVAPSRRRWALHLAVLAALAALLWEPLRVFVGNNTHVVVAGKIYRGAQPYGSAAFHQLVQRYGVRTILNLRGTGYPTDWYIDEAKAVQEMGIALEDVSFSAGRYPSKYEVHRLVEALDHAEYPIFMHCRHGADRTGLAAVIAQVLLTDTSYAAARRQLSLRYAHAPIGRTTILDGFFELYEQWLQREGRTHDAVTMRHWLLHEYGGGSCQAAFEQVTPLHEIARVGEPLSWRVRARNISTATWQFKPTRTAGHHLGYFLWDENGKLVGSGRAGFFEQAVVPADTVTITLVVPPVKTPGRYRLMVDLLEEGHCWFFQIGSEPYEEDLDVRD